MSIQLIVQILMFLAAVSCVIIASFITYAVIGEINRKLPDTQQIPYFWGNYSIYRRVKFEYRRLYPEGRLLLYCNILTYATFGFVLAIALCWRFGVFR